MNTETCAVKKADWHDWKTVFECWSEGTLLLMKDIDSGKFKVVHTYEVDAKSYAVGDEYHLTHDQTGRRIGYVWEVVAIQPHNKLGIKLLGQFAKKKSLTMATFK